MFTVPEFRLLVRPDLGHSLATILERLSARTVRAVSALTEADPASVLIVASSQCSPEECAALVQQGRGVVVLAALPGPSEEAAYVAAGAAAYLPMSIDAKPLLAAIEDIEERPVGRGRKPSGSSPRWS